MYILSEAGFASTPFISGDVAVAPEITAKMTVRLCAVTAAIAVSTTTGETKMTIK